MRHVLCLSGGKDSTALAIYIKDTRPHVWERLELIFTDTDQELPETYEYLDRIEAYTKKPIVRLKVRDHEGNVVPNAFDYVLREKYSGFLPSPFARWCTRELKIKPMEQYLGDDQVTMYIGIRADEPHRQGYQVSGRSNITPAYPFVDDGITIKDVFTILQSSVGMPDYYKWRTRSGCTFCFYQRRVEWALLYYLNRERFEHAMSYETSHEDGRSYTWIHDKPLSEIAEDAPNIILRYVRKQLKANPHIIPTLVHTPDEIETLILSGQVKQVVDSWDMFRIHNPYDDEEAKEGCTICIV